MKMIALAAILVALITATSFSVALAKPAVPPARDIGRGVFIDYGYSSPPWYPPDEETSNYKWAPRIYWASQNLPIDITVYTGNEPISGTFTAIQTGFTTWDDETSISIYGSITQSTGTWPGVVLDGGNSVGWASVDGPGGIIGVTYYWYYRNTREMVEFDIVLDSDDNWSTSGALDAFDVQNIATHEAGHTLVLGDLPSPRDGALTMHAYTWLGDTIKRTLGLGDILGIQAIYGE